MSVLRNLESKLADLVEGTFGRVFRSEVRPVELARKLAKEMDEHRTVSVSRTYVPNEYVVYLSADDRARFEGVEHEVIDELSGYLLEHARRERLALVSRPKIEFQTDERLALGEFGIQARTVRASTGGEVQQADHGHTMVYSTSDRLNEQLAEARVARTGRGVVLFGGKRFIVGAGGAVLGRSRECEVVLDDANVSRKHAEIRPGPHGWTVADLGSTNGTRVNGRTVSSGAHPLEAGDRLELGTAVATFETQEGRGGRARLRRPQVRLPRPPVPLPAVGLPPRAARPAQQRARAPPRGRARRGDEPVCRERRRRQPAAAAGRRARARPRGGARLRHRRRGGPRPRRRRRDPPRGPVRLLAPRAAGPPGRGHRPRGPQLHERHLPQRGAGHGPAAAAPRRPHPHRGLRVHLRGSLVLRVAEEFHKSDPGRQRRGNEDSVYARAPLFVVADGMGGAQAGEVASGVAVDTMGRGLPDGGGPPQDRLAALVEEANERIHELSRSDANRAGMGTTLTAVYVGEDEAAIAHVGASRAYLRRKGELTRLTEDHSLVEELLRQGKLTAEEASDHPQKSIITRALGPEPVVDVDRQTLPLRDGDVILLCSDGLTSMIGEDDVARVLASDGSLPEIGERLIDEANAAGGRDNITVVLFRIEDVGGAGTASREQDTTAGHNAPSTADVRAAVATAEAAPPPRAPRPRPAAAAPPPPRRRRRVPAVVKGGIAVVVLLAIVGMGLWIAAQAVYFVGTDDDARVAVFRGLPYDLPLGVDLYSTNYVSGVTVPQVPRGRRATLLDHTLRSRDDAYDLVRRLERGEVR